MNEKELDLIKPQKDDQMELYWEDVEARTTLTNTCADSAEKLSV